MDQPTGASARTQAGQRHIEDLLQLSEQVLACGICPDCGRKVVRTGTGVRADERPGSGDRIACPKPDGETGLHRLADAPDADSEIPFRTGDLP